ncbi:MAG: peptidylprolyl isomerase, partial [Ktedonobacteraceae bacterium]|nr:peptidylprolyl isomerase [Ktedonobacteraceae bacterium]
RVQTRRYTRQTARVEARRDGQPLIFGWGSHLSRTEKVALQRRAIWTAIALTVVLIIGVFVAYWVNINVIVPNQPITSVNGQAIPQADYHKLVGLKALLEENKIKGVHGLYAQRDDLQSKANAQKKIVTDTQKQIDTLNQQIKALPAGSSSERTNLENQLKTAKASNGDAQKQYISYNEQYQGMLQANIPGEEALYNQSQIGNDSAQWLQEDVLSRNWLAKQSSDMQNKIQPNGSAIEHAVGDLKADLPKGKTYASVLSSYNISDDDVHTMMALKLRRDNMQSYLASQISSPARQVKAEAITLSTTKDANDILSQLKGGSDFAKLAKAKSVDNATKTQGGELGWLAKGQYIKDFGTGAGGVIDNWLLDPARQANDLSPVLTDNGTYHIVKLEQVDPARAIADSKLAELKDNALAAWLQSQKAQPGVKIDPVDQNKLLDPTNMPASIPAAAPSQQGAPGGIPGQGVPGGLPGQQSVPAGG